MRNSKEHATTSASAIRCLEVLISTKVLTNNLQWTLSVYSLENQPVRGIATMENSITFHFMVFDWRRTIKKLLDDNQIPYTITQYFNAGSLYSESLSGGSDKIIDEVDCLTATTARHSVEAGEYN